MLKLKTKIPKKSGVYFFKDKNKKIIYIGKAADLRNRLRFYLSKSIKDMRVLNMLETADGLEWQETGSEIEALILESQLIKKHRPKFNILMRDDKQYFYVNFTKDIFPKIFTSHQQKDIGPFTDGGALKITLKVLRRVFPYCTCKQTHHNYCLNYHLENCPGYCCLKNESRITRLPWPGAKVTDGQVNYELRIYQKNIGAIRNILSGKRVVLAKQLEKEMMALAKKEKFKEAIKIRKQLDNLKKVFENARIINKSPEDCPQGVFNDLPRRIEAYDVSNIQGTDAVGAMAVFTDGQPDKSQYRKFKIQSKSSPDDIAMLKEVLSRRLRHKEWPMPDLILVDGGKAQLNTASSIIPKQIQIIALTKNKKHQADHVFTPASPKPFHLDFLTPDVRKLILWADSEAHRFAISYYRKTHRKTALDKSG
ncbi:MAG: GIY-YIG nuclease family protein [Candidatus Yanofskybacteria bacterium]|nr:GIY-YIG nuclease family protein [Candidatus Yanofskybacteria bacterium]